MTVSASLATSGRKQFLLDQNYHFTAFCFDRVNFEERKNNICQLRGRHIIIYRTTVSSQTACPQALAPSGSFCTTQTQLSNGGKQQICMNFSNFTLFIVQKSFELASYCSKMRESQMELIYLIYLFVNNVKENSLTAVFQWVSGREVLDGHRHITRQL